MSSGSPASSNQAIAPGAWMVLALVALSYCNLYIDRALVNYVQKPMAREFELFDRDGAGKPLLDDKGEEKLDDERLGETLFWFFTPYAIAQLAAGYLGDRFRRRTIILVSLTGSALVLAASAFAGTYNEFLAWRVAMGLIQAPAVPAFSNAIADVFSSKTRSLAVALYLASYNSALIVAGKYGGRFADTPSWNFALGTWSASISGWRLAMLVFAAVALAAAGAFALLFREPERRERQSGQGMGTEAASLRQSLVAVLTNRTYLTIATQFLLTTFVVNVVSQWLARYLLDRFELTQETAGTWSTLGLQGGAIVGLLSGGLLGDWLARRFLAGRTGVQFAGVLLATPALVMLGLGARLEVVVPATFVYGLGVGWYQSNLWATTFEVIDPAARATAIGLLNFVAGVFGSWIGKAVGRYHEALGGLGQVMALMSVLFVAALVVMILNMLFLLPKDHLEANSRRVAS